MIGIVISSSFHCYYIHSSSMDITHIIHNSRNSYVVSNIQGAYKLGFSENEEKTLYRLWEKGEDMFFHQS